MPAPEPDQDDDALSALVASGAFGTRTGVHKAVPLTLVQGVVQLIDSTHIVTTASAWRAKDRTTTGRGGRRPLLNDRAVIALMLIAAIDQTPLLATRLAALADQLQPEAKQLLGIPATLTDESYAAVWRAIHRFLKLIDPYPISRYTITPRDEYEQRVAELDPALIVERRARLDMMANMIVQSAYRALLDRKTRRKWEGNVALDATYLPVPSHAMFDGRTTDHQAGWYSRTAETHSPFDEKGRRRKDSKFGYELTVAIQTANDPHTAADFPLLALGVTFEKPAATPALLGLIALKAVSELGMPVGKFIADRNYSPSQKQHKFQIPVTLMGYQTVCDFKVDQLGIKRGHRGANQIEGSWYCPSMPEPLVNATIDWRNKTIDLATFQARIKQRRAYKLKAKELPAANGSQPLMCPAVGPGATAACPLKPDSQIGPNVATRVRIRPPDKPDAICTNATSVSFPITAGAKYGQHFDFMSQEWKDWYGLRSTVESFNAYIKDTNYEAAGSADRRRIRGLPAQYIFLAISVLAANIRKIRTWVLGRPVNPQKRITRRQRQAAAKQAQENTLAPYANSPPVAA